MHNPEASPYQPEIKAVKLQKTAEQYFGDRLWELDVVIDEKTIGRAEISHGGGERVSIESLYIDPAERGKGYGKQAYQAIVDMILSEFPDTERITSVITNAAAFRVSLNAQVPEGWIRMFRLSVFNRGEYVHFKTTDDEAVAYECIGSGGAVNVVMAKTN